MALFFSSVSRPFGIFVLCCFATARMSLPEIVDIFSLAENSYFLFSRSFGDFGGVFIISCRNFFVIFGFWTFWVMPKVFGCFMFFILCLFCLFASFLFCLIIGGMIGFDFYGIGGVSGLEKYSGKLGGFLRGFLGRGQGFCEVVDDESVVEEVEEFVGSVAGKYSDVVLLGMGGSSLGARFLLDALGGRDASLSRFWVLDNVDPDLVDGCLSEIDLGSTLFLVVSKSGDSLEVLALYAFFSQLVEKSGGAVSDHFVFVTEDGDGDLRKIAVDLGIKCFDVPKNVGGRFSVLTCVGLLPAAFMGIDIRGLLRGAREMRDLFLSDEASSNLSFQFAMAQFFAWEEGRNTVVMMPYASRLRGFNAWYSQLLAESTGKVNASGEPVGLTPLSAIGASDQHSLLQLFMDGPDDKLVCFLRVKDFGKFDNLKEFDFEGKNISFASLLDISYRATAQGFCEKQRQYLTIELPVIDAETIGQLIFCCEGAVAFLGEALCVNAFDQPGVERGKVIAREMLCE